MRSECGRGLVTTLANDLLMTRLEHAANNLVLATRRHMRTKDEASADALMLALRTTQENISVIYKGIEE